MSSSTTLLACALLGLAACAGSSPSHADAAAPTPTGDPLTVATTLASQGDQAGAMKAFEDAVRTDPGNARLQYTFATWLNRWHVRGAAFHLDAARDAPGNDYAMKVSIGHEYRLAGEFGSCVAILDQAVSEQDGGEVRTERALCKIGLRDDASALADLKAAVATEPTYAQGHFFLAGRYALARRFADAAQEYQAYLSLAPNGSLSDQATQRLQMAQQAAAEHDKGTVATKKSR